MQSLLTTFIRKLRDDKGAAAFETLIVLPSWIIMLTIWLCLAWVVGLNMVERSVLNRVAFQTAALGCLSPQEQAQAVSNATAFDVKNVSVSAVTTSTSNTPFSLSQVVDSQGDTYDVVADCTGTPDSGIAQGALNDGGYILVQLKYSVGVPVIGTMTVHLNEVVKSQSLEGN
jgi:hypothetical protein